MLIQLPKVLNCFAQMLAKPYVLSVVAILSPLCTSPVFVAKYMSATLFEKALALLEVVIVGSLT